MNIPAELFHNDTAHRSLSADPVNGILSCGFLVKPTDHFSHDTMLFSHYGAFLLLSGSGRYSDPSGREVEPVSYTHLPDRRRQTQKPP